MMDTNKFDCPYCNKTFSQQVNRDRHVGASESHAAFGGCTGPFKCIYCNKVFKTRDNMMKHVRVKRRTGYCPVSVGFERKHQCKKCGIKFLRQKSLDDHECKNDSARVRFKMTPARLKYLQNAYAECT